MIHVNRGTTNLGVFSENEVREGLSAGRFAPTDIGWREGMASWQPLSHFPEFADAVDGAYSTARSIQRNETRRRFRRAAHLCADRRMHRRDRGISVLTRFSLPRFLHG